MLYSKGGKFIFFIPRSKIEPTFLGLKTEIFGGPQQKKTEHQKYWSKKSFLKISDFLAQIDVKVSFKCDNLLIRKESMFLISLN